MFFTSVFNGLSVSSVLFLHCQEQLRARGEPCFARASKAALTRGLVWSNLGMSSASLRLYSNPWVRSSRVTIARVRSSRVIIVVDLPTPL